MQKLPTVNRWKWWDNGFNKVSVDWEEGKPWMGLTFNDPENNSCTLLLKKESVQQLIDSLQEIIGPPADKHVAFPESYDQQSESYAEQGREYGT